MFKFIPLQSRPHPTCRVTDRRSDTLRWSGPWLWPSAQSGVPWGTVQLMRSDFTLPGCLRALNNDRETKPFRAGRMGTCLNWKPERSQGTRLGLQNSAFNKELTALAQLKEVYLCTINWAIYLEHLRPLLSHRIAW